jgi:hypothetical protein
MSYSILKCPSEEQWLVIGVVFLLILCGIGVYYAIQGDVVETIEYKLFISEMGCDALEFQALNHEWESKRSLALQEHGGRC